MLGGRAGAVRFGGEYFDGLFVRAAGLVVLVHLEGALDCVDLGEVSGLAVTRYCALAAVLEAAFGSSYFGTDDHRLYPVKLEDVHILWHRISCIRLMLQR